MVTGTYPVPSGYIHHETNRPSPTDPWPSLHVWTRCSAARFHAGGCRHQSQWPRVGGGGRGGGRGRVESASTTLCLLSSALVGVRLQWSAAFTLRTMVLDSRTFSAAKFNSLVFATVFRKREPSTAHSPSNVSRSVVPRARDPRRNVLVFSIAVFPNDTLTSSAGIQWRTGRRCCLVRWRGHSCQRRRILHFLN